MSDSSSRDESPGFLLKFAVVREDPVVEKEVVRRVDADDVLVVASGGCTALELKRYFKGISVTGFDFNPLQLEHLRQKIDAVADNELTRLNVKDASPTGLNQCGDFERLFRTLREFLCEYVASEDEFDAFFTAGLSVEHRRKMVRRWTDSAYWPAAFEAVFSDEFLLAMFGPEPIQHAEPGSYPGYFQRVIARGLMEPDAPENPFLQHILLGMYRDEDALPYLNCGRRFEVDLVEGTLLDVPDLQRFDVFSLSNIFDWSDAEMVTAWADRIVDVAKPGSAVIIRQLNNRRNLRKYFEPAFEFDRELGRSLLERDRSLFYDRIEVGFRRE